MIGVNIETIRYYQRRGLLDEPPKPLGGHRRYAPDQARQEPGVEQEAYPGVISWAGSEIQALVW